MNARIILWGLLAMSFSLGVTEYAHGVNRLDLVEFVAGTGAGMLCGYPLGYWLGDPDPPSGEYSGLAVIAFIEFSWLGSALGSTITVYLIDSIYGEGEGLIATSYPGCLGGCLGGIAYLLLMAGYHRPIAPQALKVVPLVTAMCTSFFAVCCKFNPLRAIKSSLGNRMVEIREFYFQNNQPSRASSSDDTALFRLGTGF